MRLESHRRLFNAMKAAPYELHYLVHSRMCPWHLPRACYADMDELPESGKVMSVQTEDLLVCPTWNPEGGVAFPWKPGMLDFRRRWSHREIQVAAPEMPDYGGFDATEYWACKTDWKWRVVGPRDFLWELRSIEDEPSPFPDALPFSERSERRAGSLYLCQHEIRGD